MQLEWTRRGECDEAERSSMIMLTSADVAVLLALYISPCPVPD